MYSDAISVQTSSLLLVEQVGPRLQVEDLERREHDRGGRRGRQPERQQRHQRARERGVVGRLRPGDALDRAVAELVRSLRRRFSVDRTGTSAARPRPPAARRTESRSRCRAATASTSAAFAAGSSQRAAPAPVVTRSSSPPGAAWPPCAAPRRPRTGRPPRSRCRSRCRAVDAERQSRLAGELVDADEAEQEPTASEPSRGPATGHLSAVTVANASSAEREVVLGPELHREVRDRLGEERERDEPSVPATNDPIAAVASAARARPRWPSRSPRSRSPPTPTRRAC